MTNEKVLAEGFGFPEGPAFDREGNLWIVELANRRVSKIAPDGRWAVVADMGGSPNGLAFGTDGNAYVCNGGGRWSGETCTNGVSGNGGWPAVIQRLYPDGRFETLIEEIDGQTLNGPNDLCFDDHGGFYFTDPVWPDFNDPSTPITAMPPGTLCYSTMDGDARRVHTGMVFPNGIGVTEDGATLLVPESGTSKVLAFPIEAPGQLGEPREHAELRPTTTPDGMCFDSEGRSIVAGHGSGRLHVFSPEGGLAEETIELEDKDVTNVCFGGPDFSTLYVTESDSGRVASVEWKVPGMRLFPDR